MPNLPTPRKLPERRTRALLLAALSAGGLPPGFDLGSLESAGPGFVHFLPGWVRTFGVLTGSAGTVLWCDSRTRPGPTFPSQMILELPPGRYFIEAFDIENRAWISRESAAGGPLVAGLPWNGRPLLVLVRPAHV